MIQWIKLLQQLMLGKLDNPHERMTLDPYLVPLTKLILKCKTLCLTCFKHKSCNNQTPEKVRKCSLTLVCNYFGDMTPKAQATRVEINKWDYIRLKMLQHNRNNQRK